MVKFNWVGQVATYCTVAIVVNMLIETYLQCLPHTRLCLSFSVRWVCSFMCPRYTRQPRQYTMNPRRHPEAASGHRAPSWSTSASFAARWNAPLVLRRSAWTCTGSSNGKWASCELPG